MYGFTKHDPIWAVHKEVYYCPSFITPTINNKCASCFLQFIPIALLYESLAIASHAISHSFLEHCIDDDWCANYYDL